MAKVNGINHITFATLHLKQAIKFYTEILGFDLVAQWRTGAHLLSGNLWLCLSYDENTKTQALAEYTHIALDIKENDFKQLEEKIILEKVPTWKKNKSEGLSIYILDPDNNKLEVHASSLVNRLRYMLENPYPNMVMNESFLKKYL